MRLIVLQNAEGAHLGFMLCSPDLTEPSGHCVFMVVPRQAELFHSPEAELLFERREAGESTWDVVRREPLAVQVRSPGISAEMFLDFDCPAPGQWGVDSGTDRRVVGRAVLPSSD